MNKLFAKRFAELEEEMRKVKATAASTGGKFNIRHYVSDEAFLEWKIKVRNLVVKICGESSEHYKELAVILEGKSARNSWSNFCGVKSVLLAAKEDFKGGYLTSMRTLVQAEVFSDELEQADELLKNGYYVAAAVIAGVVLETGIRELCTRNKIDHAKLNKMNADLAKAGVYNKLEQKKITALADIRNSAAHGKTDEFTKDDVGPMIRDIERFLGVRLAD